MASLLTIFKEQQLEFIKLQIHWIAFLNHPRWLFMLITLLGLPIAVLCFWVGYMTNFTSQDVSDWPVITVIIWGLIAIPAKVMPVVYPLHLFVSLITGAFTAEFWECVEAIRKKSSATNIENES